MCRVCDEYFAKQREIHQHEADREQDPDRWAADEWAMVMRVALRGE